MTDDGRQEIIGKRDERKDIGRMLGKMLKEPEKWCQRFENG